VRGLAQNSQVQRIRGVGMLSGLSRRYAQLERRKGRVLAGLANLGEDRLRQRPTESAWSRLEVLDHVVKTEESIMVEAWNNLPLGVAVTRRVKARIVLVVMSLPTRIRVPAGVEFVLPDSSVNQSDLLRRWDAARVNLRAYLESIGPEQARRGCFEHPVGGWMDVPLALGFLDSHLRHHQYQLARIARLGA